MGAQTQPSTSKANEACHSKKPTASPEEEERRRLERAEALAAGHVDVRIESGHVFLEGLLVPAQAALATLARLTVVKGSLTMTNATAGAMAAALRGLRKVGARPCVCFVIAKDRSWRCMHALVPVFGGMGLPRPGPPTRLD